MIGDSIKVVEKIDLGNSQTGIYFDKAKVYSPFKTYWKDQSWYEV